VLNHTPTTSTGAGRLSLNLATIRAASFERKLHAAYTAGFSAVGLLRHEIEESGEEGLTELQLSGLRVSELVSVSGWADVDSTSRTIALAKAEQTFELARDLGCDIVVAEPDRGPVDLVTAAGQFRELCRLADPYGMLVGLEFSGAAARVKDLAASWQLVEAAEADNGGLVLDTFHFHLGGSTLRMLEPVPGDKIFLVQVSDSMHLPRHELADCHRLYPGEGTISLEPILAALGEKGYAGYYSLEVLNEGYWQEDPVIVARDGMRAMRRLQLI